MKRCIGMKREIPHKDDTHTHTYTHTQSCYVI